MRFAITLTVDSSDAGKTLLEWLAYMLVDETRESVLESIREGRVAIDQVPATDPDVTLGGGARVAFQERPADGSSVDWSASDSAGELVLASEDHD